jgi:hypothetical protein
MVQFRYKVMAYFIDCQSHIVGTGKYGGYFFYKINYCLVKVKRLVAPVKFKLGCIVPIFGLFAVPN